MDVSSLWALRIGQGPRTNRLQELDHHQEPDQFDPFLSPQAATSSAPSLQADPSKSCHNKFGRFAAVAENLVRALLTSQDLQLHSCVSTGGEKAEGAKLAAPTAEGCSAQTATADRCASSKETADPRFHRGGEAGRHRGAIRAVSAYAEVAT